MKLQVSKITPEPAVWHVHTRLDRLPRLTETAGPQTATLDTDLNVRLRGDSIVVQGRLTLTLTLPCTRCLDEVPVEVDTPFEDILVPARQNTGSGELQLSQADLNVSFFEGDFIDLTELAEEQILLALEDQVHCREDCRGLCPRCGKNLNREECGCAAESSGHPFAGMQDLLKT
ncbi:MAG: DUF177 domain-containing protein [Deltaproteobacteria bacterium]|nr:DUF177 domain-containing protein [Deltaproteobacteria bacterium]